MKQLEIYSITNNTELIFAQTTLKNLLKQYSSADPEFLKLAVMELGTNILKHATHGSLIFFLLNGNLGICSLDNGPGIENLSFALEKGTSSLSNSLGLGLYSLRANDLYTLEVVTFTKEDKLKFTGSAITLTQKVSYPSESLFYSIPLYNTQFNGDFCVSKGRHTFMGDVSGHGKNAAQSAEQIQNFFLERPVSCVTMNEFFEDLHQFINSNSLRSVVGCIIEKTNKQWGVCGIGNLVMLTCKDEKFHYHHFPNGIIGEVRRHASKFSIERTHSTKLVVVSDGVDLHRGLSVLNKCIEISMCATALAVLHFAGVHDDRSIYISI
jgi:anti-sigma regulatory factor (Ser/Thr protein kinase)